MKWILPIMLGTAAFIAVNRAASLKPGFTKANTFRVLKPGHRIALFGSSSAAGLYPHLKVLAQASGNELKYTYSNGTTVSYWLTRAAQFLKSIGGSDIIIVVLGGNDSKTNYSGEQHRSFVKRLLDEISEYGNVYWVLPFRLPWKDNFSQIVKDEKVLNFETYLHEIPMASDKVHALPSGYQQQASLIWQDLTRERSE